MGMNAGFRPYDPESLLTGAELAKGYTYTNSHREYPDEAVKQAIINGYYTIDEVTEVAPRVFNEGYIPPKPIQLSNEGFEEEYSI